MAVGETYITSFLDNSSFLNGRVGFWGTVCKQKIDTHRVDVIMDIGRKILDIPVAMNTWVTKNDNDNYVTGERNLPPIGAFVFVLMPTKTVSGAFVLCSGIPYGEAFASDFYKNTEPDTKTTTKKDFGKWQIDKNRDNGDLTIANSEKEITLNVDDKNIAVTSKGNCSLNINGVTISIDGNKNINVTTTGTITLTGSSNAKLEIG